VIGLFANPSQAALCLSNLAEADFRPPDISLVMRTRREVEELADISGPLTGLSPGDLHDRLVRLGLSLAEAAVYRDGVLQGGVFVALSGTVPDSVAAEMLGDAAAQGIRVVGKATA
jgi:hypothetical protein